MDAERSGRRFIFMTERKVVITGIGVISPLGNDLATTWDGLKNGVSGIDTISLIDPDPYPCKIAGEVKDFDPKLYFKNPKDARRSDRYAQLAVAASKMALDDSGLESDSLDRDRVGVLIGSGIGGLGSLEAQHRNLLNRGASKVSPFVIPMMISNIASGMISMDHGFGGPNMAIVTACATSNHNIGEAWRMIKFGDADAFLAGGSEAAILPMGMSGFSNMRAMSTRNDDPQRASRPFDRDRDGFVMGEGSGVIVVEEFEHARKRGATIYAELIGYGLSADAHHMTAPHPEGSGARRCMNMALHHAGVNPEDVDYVNAHGTSTPVGDVAETKAIKKSFGDYAKNGLLVSSTKSMTGHLMGAAGGVEIAACLMAIQEGVVPPTINIENQDEECDLDFVANEARETPITCALSNSFGFGGHNASLLVRKM
jgi:3-oxoacyl-[acyl-carrier-protein] synthase II